MGAEQVFSGEGEVELKGDTLNLISNLHLYGHKFWVVTKGMRYKQGDTSLRLVGDRVRCLMFKEDSADGLGI